MPEMFDIKIRKTRGVLGFFIPREVAKKQEIKEGDTVNIVLLKPKEEI